MYHYIRNVPDTRDRLGIGLSVSPEVFAAQMAFLAKEGYHPITLRQLARALRGEGSLPSRPIVLTFDDGYRDFYTTAWPILRRYDFQSTVFVISGVVDRPAYLTRQQLIELDRSGLVEIASHTVSHPDLTTLAVDRLRHELVESRRQLSEWIGRPVTSFAYPAGRYHAGVLAMVQTAGYEQAVTTQSGREHSAQSALELRRLRVSGPSSVAALSVLLGP